MSALLVDGMNVIGTRPTGWWRDRDGAVRRFVERLQPLAAAQPVTVVFDGRPLADLAEGLHGQVVVRYAQRHGPNAADDRIVELLTAAQDPAHTTVVTSDRDLRERVRELGAAVVGARDLLRRLDALTD